MTNLSIIVYWVDYWVMHSNSEINQNIIQFMKSSKGAITCCLVSNNLFGLASKKFFKVFSITANPPSQVALLITHIEFFMIYFSNLIHIMNRLEIIIIKISFQVSYTFVCDTSCRMPGVTLPQKSNNIPIVVTCASLLGTFDDAACSK